jgi:hypothetical protein
MIEEVLRPSSIGLHSDKIVHSIFESMERRPRVTVVCLVQQLTLRLATAVARAVHPSWQTEAARTEVVPWREFDRS